MEEIAGKTLVFTDFHIGLKSGSKTRLKICAEVMKRILAEIDSNSVQNVLFLGDWHHVRNATENNVMNVSYKLMAALQKHAKVWCILGNHDLYMKNSADVHSLVMFKDLPNVKIIDKPAEVLLNGKLALLVPWLGDVTPFGRCKYDMLFGHFDVSHKYLLRTYVEEHAASSKASAAASSEIDSALKLESMPSSAGDFIGDFIEAAREDGVVFSGHIHKHKELLAKGRKFVFVGDPYQQNFGERDYECGFYVVNEDCSYEFKETTGIPKHIDLKMSEIAADISKYDFSKVTGNIIHKTYDIDIDTATDAKIAQKINDMRPYEELLPDYAVGVSMQADDAVCNESIELIKKSKLDYIKNYISNIDKKVLEEQKVDPMRLYAMLADYYSKVTEDK